MTHKCKYYRKIYEGSTKKVYCSDSCRIYSHRESKWKPMNQLTPEEWEKIIKFLLHFKMKRLARLQKKLRICKMKNFGISLLK